MYNLDTVWLTTKPQQSILERISECGEVRYWVVWKIGYHEASDHPSNKPASWDALEADTEGAEPARVHPPRAAPWVESSDEKDGEITGDWRIVLVLTNQKVM